MPRDFVNENDGSTAVAVPIPSTARAVPASPAVETDEVLRCLIESRQRIETNWSAGSRPDLHRGPNPMCAQNTIFTSGYNYREVVSPAQKLLGRMLPTPGAWQDVWRFNDTHSHADVLALFDRAIASRRAALEGGPHA